MLDLGAIGKGYAIEQAAELLREAGVTSGLVHGGTSTIYALGHPPESEAWQIAITSPESGAALLAKSPAVEHQPEAGPGKPATPAAVVALKDEAMSVSAVWGKFFQAEGETYGHIIDPRTGYPASQGVMAVVVLGSATETDALSTALLTLGPEGHDQIANLREGMRTLVMANSASGGEFRRQSKGIELL
jgi:thiamine biosynthesis lipoprotein